MQFLRMDALSTNPRWRRIAALAFFACATLFLQYLSGAFTHELGGAPDEAAHFMNGLLIHDYVASGIRTTPFNFAEEYYAHYPKIAFGIWPPLFHAIEGAWMLLTSPTKVSVLLMLALISTLLAYLLYLTIERYFGSSAGICAGLLLISVPVMQQSTSLVMLDSLFALFSFLAIYRYGRYLDGGCWQDSAWFGIWASAAILTKYNGLALAFIPPLCALFTGRWRIFRRGSTWLAAGIVLVICGSWYLPMWHLVSYAAEPLPSFATVWPAMRFNTVAMAGLMGVPLLMVAAAGVMFTLRRRWLAKNSGIWVAAAALIVSCWIFHSIATQDPEQRYLLAAVAPLILFLAVGIDGLSCRLRLSPVHFALALLLLYAVGTFKVIETPHLGYAAVASAISHQSGAPAIILADGMAESEGMAVSEIAIREHRPAHYVLRGSKVLATSTWMGRSIALFTGPRIRCCRR